MRPSLLIVDKIRGLVPGTSPPWPGNVGSRRAHRDRASSVRRGVHFAFIDRFCGGTCSDEILPKPSGTERAEESRSSEEAYREAGGLEKQKVCPSESAANIANPMQNEKPANKLATLTILDVAQRDGSFRPKPAAGSRAPSPVRGVGKIKAATAARATSGQPDDSTY